MIEKVFIDTSVFIRFLTGDIPQKYEASKSLIQMAVDGKIYPYISNVVLMEIAFVLKSVYTFPKVRILTAFSKLLSLRNITVIEQTDSISAVKMYQTFNIKYPDCLIALQIPENATIVTYDKDFSKIPHLKVVTPQEFLRSKQT